MLVASTSLFAQERPFSVEAGWLHSNVSAEGSLKLDGAYAGLNYAFDISDEKGFYFTPGLLLEYQKSTTYRNKSKDYSYYYDEFALNIPLMIGYKVNLGSDTDTRFFVNAGPLFYFGFVGDLNYKTLSSGNKVRVNLYKMDEYLVGSKMGRIDIQIGANTGVDFGGWLKVLVGCDYGLVNRMRVDGTNARTFRFYVGGGFCF